MTNKPNILVVCGRNKRRSRTAEYIFKNDSRFDIRSVGLSSQSERQIKENDLAWSDLILVMEDEQEARIRKTYKHIDLPKIKVLYVDDIYEYLDNELVELLHDDINRILKSEFNI